MRAWQRRWHEILDDYDHPEETDEDRGVPHPLPDMMADNRLLFCFWHAEWQAGSEARKRAFDILPRGEAMLARVEEYLSSKSTALDAKDAERILRRGLALTRKLGIDAPDPEHTIRVFCEDDMPVQEAFDGADTPFINLRDKLGEMALQECGQVGKDAYHFLAEPLYHLASSYDVAKWVVWLLCAQAGTDDPTEAAYRLWSGGWSSGWNSEGVFLFDRRKEFRLI